MGQKSIRWCFFIAALLCATIGANGQQLTREKIVELLAKDGCATLEKSKVKICKADYSHKGDTIGAISFQPLDREKSPGILLIPGYQGEAQRYITLGTLLAQQGFACLSVDHPGFGKSKMKPDFVGPNTLKALIAGFKKLHHQPYVDKEKIGIFGYSRGGMAASLMVVQLKDVRAAVLGAGVYDFKKAYDETKIEGIRENMKAEAGLSDKAIKDRSSVLRMNKLRSPILILHSEQDENVPVSQAYLLRDRLTELKKDFEVRISPKGKHGFMDGDFISTVISFLGRRLKGVDADVKVR